VRDTKELALEAGLPEAWISETGVLKWSDLKAFEALVRADERDRAIRENAYVLAEREACAKVCDIQSLTVAASAKVCAEAIRARGETK
jgi:hypothetical protein